MCGNYCAPLSHNAAPIKSACGSSKRSCRSARGETLELSGNDEIAELSKALATLAEAPKREAAEIRAALDAHSIVAITDSFGKITYVNP